MSAIAGAALVGLAMLIVGFVLGMRGGYRRALAEVETDPSLRRVVLEQLAALEGMRLEGRE